MARVNKKLKHRIGQLAVGVAALGALPDVMVASVHVELDGAHWHGKVSQIVIGNTRQYAGFTSMTPDAYANDGHLDVCLITATTPFLGMRQLASLALRGHASQATAELYRAASIVVRSPVVFPLETDGSVIKLDEDDCTSDGVVYTFRTMAQGVSVLVPRAYQGDLFEPARLWTRAPLAPLKPVSHQNVLESDDGGRAGERLRKRAKWFSQRYQVISLSGDTFIAAREKDGHVVKVVITPETTLKGMHDDKKRPLWGQLTALNAEDVVRIKGIKGTSKGSIIAYRLKCEAPATLQTLHAG